MSQLPALILVPGAFHFPTCFDPLASLLRKEGYEVSTPAAAATGSTDATKTLLDDIQTVKSAIEKHVNKGKDVVVVGHSMGAISAGAAVEDYLTGDGGKGKIVAVVFIAGVMVQKDKNLFESFPPPHPADVQDGIVNMPQDAETRQIIQSTFYPIPPFSSGEANTHLDAMAKCTTLLQALTPNPYIPYSEEGGAFLPLTYAITESDGVVKPELQEGWVELLGKGQKSGKGHEVTVERMKGNKVSHMIILSDPEGCKDIIDRAVKRVTK